MLDTCKYFAYLLFYLLWLKSRNLEREGKGKGGRNLSQLFFVHLMSFFGIQLTNEGKESNDEEE